MLQVFRKCRDCQSRGDRVTLYQESVFCILMLHTWLPLLMPTHGSKTANCGAHDYFCISAIKMQKEGGKGPRALSLRLPPWSCTHHFHFHMGQKWITRPLLATRWFSFWVVMSLSLGTFETDLEIRENYFSKSALRKKKNVLRKEWNRCRGVGKWDKKRRSGNRVRVNRASILQTGPEAV